MVITALDPFVRQSCTAHAPTWRWCENTFGRLEEWIEQMFSLPQPVRCTRCIIMLTQWKKPSKNFCVYLLILYSASSAIYSQTVGPKTLTWQASASHRLRTISKSRRSERYSTQTASMFCAWSRVLLDFSELSSEMSGSSVKLENLTCPPALNDVITPKMPHEQDSRRTFRNCQAYISEFCKGFYTHTNVPWGHDCK